MSRERSITDEAIVAALIQGGSAARAADTLGISTKTIYERQKDRDFRELYQAAKADLIRQAVFDINRRLGDAVEVVANIMRDEETNAATRLQAAQTIINNAAKLADKLAADEQPRNLFTF